MKTFDHSFRMQPRDLLVWRRDVRRFRSEPLPSGALERLIDIACLAPSVGLSQPWRFVIVDSPERRQAVIQEFKSCNADALLSYTGERRIEYAKLKLAGLQEAPCHLAVFADTAPKLGHALGRRTMPETLEYSVVAAIYTLWLAARAEGIGVGWVSILRAACISDLLDIPQAWRFVGYLCLGYLQQEDDVPELQASGWEQRSPPDSFILRR